MSDLGSLLSYLRDPKLAAHATSALPAWLWSADATRVLWANPTAAAAFDVASPAALAGYTIDPKGSAALQIARIAGTLPLGAPPRLERLRGFGASFGRALMCACSRISLEDRTPAILVLATELGRRRIAARRTGAPAVRRHRRADRVLLGRRRPDARHAGRRGAAARPEVAGGARRRQARRRGAGVRPRLRHIASRPDRDRTHRLRRVDRAAGELPASRRKPRRPSRWRAETNARASE